MPLYFTIFQWFLLFRLKSWPQGIERVLVAKLLSAFNNLFVSFLLRNPFPISFFPTLSVAALLPEKRLIICYAILDRASPNLKFLVLFEFEGERIHLNCRLVLSYSAFSVTFYHEELDGKMDGAKTSYPSKSFPSKKVTTYKRHITFSKSNVMVDLPWYANNMPMQDCLEPLVANTARLKIQREVIQDLLNEKPSEVCYHQFSNFLPLFLGLLIGLQRIFIVICSLIREIGR